MMDDILNRLLTAQRTTRTRPFILLTWAQTTDAMLSHKPGIRTQISGPDSSTLTHSLRALHDAILVGISTVLADNPRLSTRLDRASRDKVNAAIQAHGRVLAHEDACPTAVVLDSELRTPIDANFLSQPHCLETLRRPYVFTKVGTRARTQACQLSKYIRLIEVDAKVTGKSNKLDLEAVIDQLQLEGITSIMVEGGPSVLSSFLQAGLGDLLIVTIAPVFFGQGLPLSDKTLTAGLGVTRLKEPLWTQLGNDVVLIGEPQ